MNATDNRFYREEPIPVTAEYLDGLGFKVTSSTQLSWTMKRDFCGIPITIDILKGEPKGCIAFIENTRIHVNDQHQLQALIYGISGKPIDWHFSELLSS